MSCGFELRGLVRALEGSRSSVCDLEDTFALYNQEPSAADLATGLQPIDDSDIAWKSDVDNKFFNLGGKQPDPVWPTVQWHDVTDRK